MSPAPDAPDPPVDVETHNPTSSTITLTWKPPMYDGGCKIMGYILEKQQKGEDKWERCNDFLVPVLSYTVRGLTEGKNYTFRVKAENAAGVSEPSRNTPFVKALDAVGKEDDLMTGCCVTEVRDLNFQIVCSEEKERIQQQQVDDVKNQAGSCCFELLAVASASMFS